MNKKNQAAVILISAFFIFIILRFVVFADKGFVRQPFPVKESYELYDMGVVDANGDDILDVFTTNHHYRQSLLLGDGKGGFRDGLSELGLDQNPSFPGLEYSLTAPRIDAPGLYIYFKGDDLNIRANDLDDTNPLKGTIRTCTDVALKHNDSFNITVQEEKTPAGATETTIRFTAPKKGWLSLEASAKAIPISVELNDAIPLNRVYVGNRKISPVSRNISLMLQDRHGMAWADYKGDGRMSIFTTRGAIGGYSRTLPQRVLEKIDYELLIRRPGGGFENIAVQTGLIGHDRSGRRAAWVDFNADGRLDLYANCHDRGKVGGKPYSKQLFRQEADGTFTDVAAEAGLDLPKCTIQFFVWLDADNDGDMDMLATQNNGIWLYRNNGGHFAAEHVYSGRAVDRRKYDWDQYVNIYWQFDNKIAIADYDLDGYLDAFISSVEGNVLLVNDRGSYLYKNPASIGLPAKSLTADWVDYDNDGLPDLYTVPDGLNRQLKNHHFEKTNILRLPSSKYQGALCNWFDMNNDGYRDIIIVLKEKWQRRKDLWWEVLAYRDIGAKNHWLELELVGTKKNRQAIGARATVNTSDGSQLQEVGNSEGSYYSQGHYRLYFGLGPHKKADVVKIRWPDGYQQEFKDVAGNRLLVVEREQ
jgi:hypothetical protein